MTGMSSHMKPQKDTTPLIPPSHLFSQSQCEASCIGKPIETVHLAVDLLHSVLSCMAINSIELYTYYAMLSALFAHKHYNITEQAIGCIRKMPQADYMKNWL